MSSDTEVIVSFPFNDEQDKIYFNIEIQSLTDFTTTTRVLFNQQFNQPIIARPNDYYMAISKFNIPVDDIPILIPDFIPNNTAITIYTVTLEYNNVFWQSSLVYPPPGQSTVDSPGPGTEFYGYIYTYQAFIDMINLALATAFSSIPMPVGALPPYFQIDHSNNLISLVAQRAFYDKLLANAIKVYFNKPLLVLMEHFLGIYAPFGVVPDSQGCDFQFVIEDTRNNWYNPTYLAPATPPDYYIMTQNSQSVVNWSPFASVRLQSNTIPVRYEYILSNSSNGVTGTLSAVNILQTFFPQFEENSTFASKIFYVANGNYHLLNLTGEVPLSKIDIQAYWIDTRQRAHPIYISYNQVCLIELIFLKKSTYTN